MPEDKPVHRLQKNVTKAAAIRAMCQTDGFKVLQAEFESQIKKVTLKMLDADTSTEELIKLRQKVQVWMEIQKLLKTILLTGELSSLNLSKLDAEFTKSPIKYGQGETK